MHQVEIIFFAITPKQKHPKHPVVQKRTVVTIHKKGLNLIFEIEIKSKGPLLKWRKTKKHKKHKSTTNLDGHGASFGFSALRAGWSFHL